MTDLHRTFALFPGQGSQKVGMGKDLYESSEIARELFNLADKAIGLSLSKLCFEGPPESLTATDIAQPAILTTSIISYEIAKQTLGSKLSIVAAAGHSLGEYSALVAAGAISFEDAVQLVHKRGRYMQEAVPVGVGKMVAVLGKEVAEIEEALGKITKSVAQIANVNAPGQIVVAGSVDAVDEFLSVLGSAKSIPLQVSAPFHCPLMKPAEEKLAKDLATLTIKSCSFPIIANYSAEAVTEPEKIRALLAQQVCGRVRWVESVETALKEFTPSCAAEFGAGNVLTGLVKRINNQLTRVNVYSEADVRSLI